MGSHTEEQLIEAFQLMWGKYPEPVRLIDKNEIIIAGNEAYLATSGEQMIGTRCRDLQPAELHKGCKHAKCIRSGEALPSAFLETRPRSAICRRMKGDVRRIALLGRR